MKYGYFDDENKEYVITRPDTPTPWSNYLGSTEYGALITNNAAGYSFVKSGSEGRLLRFRFNAVAPDMPGRFIYIRDRETGDYWSASWQPTGKDLSEYKSVCRHGTAYTVISSDYREITTETLYYVPLGQEHEVWHFKIRNNDSKKRRISVFSYAELTSDDNSMRDMENIQYTGFISRTYFKGNYILQSLKELSHERAFRYFGASGGVKISGWDGSREEFIGTYGSYSNPVALSKGRCSNSLNYTGNSCASLQIDLDLLPGEEKKIIFILGAGNEEIAQQKIKHYDIRGVVDDELSQLKAHWHGKLEVFQVKTPDSAFNSMMNVWHSYECFVNTFWSRTASLIYSSLRNGLGYRDTMADIQSIMHLDYKLAGERLVTMLSGQVSNGGALPLVRFDHKPGTEPVPGSAEYEKKTGYSKYRCDDALWLFQAVPQYMKESGELDFIDK
ncbi:MAG TPA: N,N'-diacetylchitobiose phosphorylase, partial [Ruminiclostridium sp.]|nr:N,N'-diacetylchitobiose phosphorylase [Ruminiclostridium sp.]